MRATLRIARRVHLGELLRQRVAGELGVPLPVLAELLDVEAPGFHHAIDEAIQRRIA